MPDFPRYESKGELTTQQPSIQAPTDNTGETTAKAGETIGSAIQTNTLKWSNAVDTIQKTTSQANFKAGMLDIQTRAANDPNYNNSDQYLKEIEKLKSESLKGFSSKTAETEMAIDLEYESKVGKIGIDNLYKKKFIDVGQASTRNLLEIEAQNPTPNSEKAIDSILATQVEKGIYGHEAAYVLGEQYKKQAKFNSFLIDFRNDPVAAEKAFNKNAYGMDIETAEKARSKLKEIKALQKEQQTSLYGDMSLGIMTGQVSEQSIDEAVMANKLNPNNGITEIQGKQLKTALYRDVTQRIGAKQFKTYKKAIDFVFSDSAQDRFRGYEAILQAYSDGLTPDESNFLKKVLDTKKDATFAAKSASGKKFLENLLGARPKNMEKETKVLLEYAKRIANGSTPEAASQETALQVIQEDHPAVVGDPTLAGAFTPSKGFKNIPKVKSESTAGRQE